MFRDNFKECNFGKMKLPKLKGHITIKQYYAKSGNLAEVIEQDNIVTNALADIFENNTLGGIDTNAMTPLHDWFGGILMYENAFATSGNPAQIDADNYLPPNDAQNHLYAHAGDIAPSDTSDDTRRGSPNSLEKQISDGYVKFGWEWGSSVGNVPDGHYIRSVALTHKDTGNCGLGSSSNAFANFLPFKNISALPNLTFGRGSFYETHAIYDDNHGLSFYIGDLGEYQASSANKQTNKVSVYIKRMPFFKAGLVDTVSSNNPIKRSFAVTTPITFYMQPLYWFDDVQKYLYLFTNNTGPNGFKSYGYSKQDISYCVIDCENETMVNLGTSQEPVYYKTISADVADLAPIGYKNTSMDDDGMPEYYQVLFDGTKIYVPTKSGTDWNDNQNGFRMINLSNNNQATYPLSNDSTFQFSRPAMFGGGLIVGNGYVINNDKAYVCSEIFPQSIYDARAFTMLQLNKASSLVYPIATGEMSRPRMLIANKMVHTTMLNLDTPVQKTNAKNMNVTYELTEVSI